jgi:cytochrome c peroxidase
VKKTIAAALLATVAGVVAPFGVEGAGDAPLDEVKRQYARPTEIPFPADNGFSAEKKQLGEMLFFDPRLSGANYISCASCHNPSLSWGDGLARGFGHGMTKLGRRTPTILNAAWADLLMWDGRKASLEDQALGPIGANVEMNQKLDELPAKLGVIRGYREAFAKAFPGEGITLQTIAKSIATYERTVVSGTAPFDRWVAGDEGAISDSAKRGFVLFNGKANCATCHAGWNFTDNSFRDIGLPDADLGRFNQVKLPSMEHAFKTPTLRDVDRRAPYMHDGSIATLAEVVEHYDRGGVKRPSLSPEIYPLGLSAAEKGDLVNFLVTLTGPQNPVQVPDLPMNPQTAAR